MVLAGGWGTWKPSATWAWLSANVPVNRPGEDSSAQGVVAARGEVGHGMAGNLQVGRSGRAHGYLHLHGAGQSLDVPSATSTASHAGAGHAGQCSASRSLSPPAAPRPAHVEAGVGQRLRQRRSLLRRQALGPALRCGHPQGPARGHQCGVVARQVAGPGPGSGRPCAPLRPVLAQAPIEPAQVGRHRHQVRLPPPGRARPPRSSAGQTAAASGGGGGRGAAGASTAFPSRAGRASSWLRHSAKRPAVTRASVSAD